MFRVWACCDMLVLEEFSDVVNPDFDMQFCKRTEPLYREDMTMDYISSFLVVNSRRSSAFIKHWIKRLNERAAAKTVAPFETPALNEMIIKYSDSFKISDLDEDIISCRQNYIPNTTRIIHLKSESPGDTFISRISNVKNYPVENFSRYVKAEDMEKAVIAKQTINLTPEIPPHKKTWFHYYRYKLLSYITFGESRKIYHAKRKAVKEALRMNSLRSTTKL